MKLEHLNLDQLKPCPLNVRKKGAKDVADLVLSIRSLGVLQPLLVRPNCEGFEVVAGQRRLGALKTLAAEGPVDPVPCLIMEDGEDATAIEASLAENVARLPMDEIDQYKAFAALIDAGESAEDIAARFGITERLVSQRLAISRIIEPILNAYRREEVRPDTLRILTMATARQQKEWYRLLKSDDEYAPVGRSLREWLFGGSQIPVSNALFDVEGYTGAIVSDLFGEERYFSKAEDFWVLQNTAIAKAREAYIEKGWQDVIILDVGQHWAGWEYTKVPRAKGGTVYVTCTHDGEVEFHEGYRLTREIKGKAEGVQGETPKAGRPELTKAMQNYLALHRQSAVSAALLDHPATALRLIAFHMLVGSPLWRVNAEPLRADSRAIADSITASRGQARHAQARTEMRQLLGIAAEDDEPVIGLRGDMASSVCHDELFTALMALDDGAVMKVLTFLMAESLSADDELIDLTGQHIGIDMQSWWKPDETFFALLRDKEALNEMVAEVAGKDTAAAHVTSTAKVQKKIITDCLDGTRQMQIENWLPRYLAFPAQGYTERFAPASLPVPEPEEDDEEDEDEAAE